MPDRDGSLSFYLFDIDDNLLFLPTRLYLWNAETRQETDVSSADFAAVQSLLGRVGRWQPWAIGEKTFRDFRDLPGVPAKDQSFNRDLQAAIASGDAWRGPSWPLLVHAAEHERPIAVVTARGHEPSTIEAGLQYLVDQKLLAAVPPILGIYTVTNPGVRDRLKATDPAMTVPSIKKLAIKDAVETALSRYGQAPPHRFGMSDDDPNNVVLAISAMRDLKVKHPDKRFFVINTNHAEFVKLEIFPMDHPATASASGARFLRDTGARPPKGLQIDGGTASVYVTNIDRAIEFYTEVLGLTLRGRVGSDWAEIDAGRGLIIGLHPARPPATPAAGAPGAINIELAVTVNLADVVATLRARDVSFTGPIQEYANVRIATLADPDGNALMLVQVLHAVTATESR